MLLIILAFFLDQFLGKIEFFVYAILSLGFAVKLIMDSIEKIKKYLIRKNSGLSKNNERNEKINRVLIEMVSKYHAMRALVYQFHNGEHFYSKNSIVKISCSHEKTRTGISEIIDNDQNKNISSLSRLIEIILEKKYLLVSTENDVTDYGILLSLEHGVDYILRVAIKNKVNEVVAIGVIHFDSYLSLKQIENKIQDILLDFKKIELYINS